MIEIIQNRDIKLNEHYLKQKEYLLKTLCFKEIKKDLFYFREKENNIYIDYRYNKRRSWATNYIGKTINKNNCAMYKIFKLKTKDL